MSVPRIFDSEELVMRTDAFVKRHLAVLFALIHKDQGEQRLDCNCTYCWPDNPEHQVVR